MLSVLRRNVNPPGAAAAMLWLVITFVRMWLSWGVVIAAAVCAATVAITLGAAVVLLRRRDSRAARAGHPAE